MILVIGGLGFIGSHVTRALLDRGESCVVTRRGSREIAPFLRADLDQRLFVHSLDVTNRDALFSLGDAHAITGIVDLADVWPSGPVDDLRGLAAGLANTIEAALAWKVARVSIASTIGVYGAAPEARLREDAVVPLGGHRHPIAATKKIAEIFAGDVAERTSLECVALRIAGIWGPLNRSMRSFPSRLVHALARGKTVDLSGIAWGAGPDDGYDHCYVRDCARAVALLQTAPKLRHRVYNVGSGLGTRNRDFVTAAKRVAPDASLGLPPAFDAPPSAGEGVALDVSRAREDAGYEPRFDLAAGIADYLAWLRADNAY